MKTKSLLFSSCLFLLLSFTLACKTPKSSETKSNTGSIDFEKEHYEKASMFDASEIAGCGFGILLENGKRLQPKNVRDEFKKDKLEVWVKYTLINTPSACQMGQVVNLTDIRKRETH